MMYFNGITNLEQAKLRYRKLAKQLHPDAGGIAQEFQKLQEEYNTLVLKFQRNSNIVKASKAQRKYNPSDFLKNESPEKELLTQLGNLAKVLIKKQAPQSYLRQKVRATKSPLGKDILTEIADILDGV